MSTPLFRRHLIAAAMLSPVLAQASLLVPNGWSNATGMVTARLVTVEVIDLHQRQPLPIFEPSSLQPARVSETYVGGRAGTRYGIRLTNRTAGNVLAVVSVDGVNVLSGEDASAHQGGYILPPYGQVTVDGWRKSLHEVAQFVLTEPGSSYASQTGRPRNVGVIGVALFEEARPVVVAPAPAPARQGPAGLARELGMSAPAQAPQSKAAPAADAAERMASSPSLGTGHGQRQESRVTRGTFERATSNPAEVVSLRYDSLHNLEAAGIAVRPRWPRPMPKPHAPLPFPADAGFVPDPPKKW